jgi:hypothetical protein
VSRQNYEDALEKLQVMIDTAATPPTGPSDETIKKVKTLYVSRVRFMHGAGLTVRATLDVQRQEGQPEAPR